MNKIVGITCKAGVGHALQRKVKCFDLACKRGGVQHLVHEKEEEQRIEVTAWSWTNVALSCSVLSKACHSSDNGQNH